MKKLSLQLIVMMCFVQITFGQVPNPNVIPGQGKGDACECGEKGINISTGFDNSSNSIFADGAIDDTWKITGYTGGTTGLNAIKTTFSAWATTAVGAAWIKPDKDVMNAGAYDYIYNFTVPAGYKAVMRFARVGGDNDVEIYVDVTDFKYFSNKADYGFKDANTKMKPCLVFDVNGAGPHKINFKVRNSGSYTGLLVQGCMELVQLVPECRCPDGWVSNTNQKDGGIVTGSDGCKKQVCVFDKALIPPKNGTVIGSESNPWGFTWGNGFYVWGTAANGGAPICTLNGKPIDWNTYQMNQGRGK
jgi:hypothetical protein